MSGAGNGQGGHARRFARTAGRAGADARGALVVVGDALLDRDIDGRVERLCPDAPAPVVERAAEHARPGGAGLAAALAAADGRRVILVTALADDAAGRELRELLAEAGIEVIDLGLGGPTAEKVRIRGSGRTLVRVDSGGDPPAGVGPAVAGAPALERARTAIAAAATVLVSDYGRGLAAVRELRTALEALTDRVPLVWDPHPRGPAPVPGARIVTPNARETAGFASEVPGDGTAAAIDRARALARAWAAACVCVTLGPEGAVLVGAEGAPLAVPAPPAAGGDPCGAGDRFASRLAGLLADGTPVTAAVTEAVACSSRFVAAGGAGRCGIGRRADGRPGTLAGDRSGAARSAGLGTGADTAPTAATAEATPAPAVHLGSRHLGPAPLEEAAALVRRVRAAGGTAVATGGCFDLLHAGHVSLLRAARELGDCLVVLLNSDSSVRRLKGADRPLVEEEDRAAVLAALAYVDAVVVFDEDTPEAALERLRPDVWAKGGDYRVEELPEAAVLERWGGHAVILPFVAGRSTTRLIEEMTLRGGG